MAYRVTDIQSMNELRDSLGAEVVLSDEVEQSTVFAIVAEFRLGGKGYAVLQSEPMKRSDEVAIYEIGHDDNGEFELVTIEDDDEWEDIYELYDEWAHSETDEA